MRRGRTSCGNPRQPSRRQSRSKTPRCCSRQNSVMLPAVQMESGGLLAASVNTRGFDLCKAGHGLQCTRDSGGSGWMSVIPIAKIRFLFPTTLAQHFLLFPYPWAVSWICAPCGHEGVPAEGKARHMATNTLLVTFSCIFQYSKTWGKCRPTRLAPSTPSNHSLLSLTNICLLIFYRCTDNCLPEGEQCLKGWAVTSVNEWGVDQVSLHLSELRY